MNSSLLIIILIIILENFVFRHQHSTQYEFWKVTELIHEGLFKKQKTCVVFVHISKAFERVWHNGLMLIMLKLRPRLILILWNYFRVKTFSVKVNNFIFASRNIEAGVPQDSLASTWLFNLNINYIQHIFSIF